MNKNNNTDIKNSPYTDIYFMNEKPASQTSSDHFNFVTERKWGLGVEM